MKLGRFHHGLAMFGLSSGFAQVFSCGPFVSPCFPLKNWEIASWHLHEFSGGCDSVRVGTWSLGWEIDSVHMGKCWLHHGSFTILGRKRQERI